MCGFFQREVVPPLHLLILLTYHLYLIIQRAEISSELGCPHLLVPCYLAALTFSAMKQLICLWIMSHDGLLSHIPGPLHHLDNHTPAGVTHAACTLSDVFRGFSLNRLHGYLPLCWYHGAIKHGGVWSSCSPPHLLPSRVSAASRTVWQVLHLHTVGPTCGWGGQGLGWSQWSQCPCLGFSAWFRSFITQEWCGSGVWERDGKGCLRVSCWTSVSAHFDQSPALLGNSWILLAVAGGYVKKGLWNKTGGSMHILVNKCLSMSNNTLTHVRRNREAKNKIVLETIVPFSQGRGHIVGRKCDGS